MWSDVTATRACAGALVMLLMCAACAHCCGPGRGGTRRRSTRKLMPLIFKEHVPNVYENTLGASGLTEGPITRDNPRFHELVPNYNPDVIFRDEEGTGADRIMTERCKERLDTLAISVMNQWPGVRLRVKEAWDDAATHRHASHSLHYEGRAVDIATSDSDRGKYGMLGRLAVEAGFDWVYYEARSHVHASVKSESPALSRLGGCFPARGEVNTPVGPRRVYTLIQGDLVEVMRPDGSTTFSPILLMIHSSPRASAEFLELHMSGGSKLTLTASHLLLVIRGGVVLLGDDLPQFMDHQLGKFEENLVRDHDFHQYQVDPHKTTAKAVFAGQVREGDHLLIKRGNYTLETDRVVRIRRVKEKGVFAPLTAEGNLLMDGVVVSCYAIIDSQALAHWSFSPVRIYYRMKGSLLSVLEALRITSATVSPSKNSSLTNNNEYYKYRNNKYNSIIHTVNKQINESYITNNKTNPEYYRYNIGTINNSSDTNNTLKRYQSPFLLESLNDTAKQTNILDESDFSGVEQSTKYHVNIKINESLESPVFIHPAVNKTLNESPYISVPQYVNHTLITLPGSLSTLRSVNTNESFQDGESTHQHKSIVGAKRTNSHQDHNAAHSKHLDEALEYTNSTRPHGTFEGTEFTDPHDSLECVESNIHWYPRLLYRLARTLLPKHLTVS